MQIGRWRRHSFTRNSDKQVVVKIFLMQSFQTENLIIFKKTVNLNTSFSLKILKRFYLSILY